ncbi:MAG: hypothetical protein U0176_15755 [Bacteroidia bacterium]
MQNTFEGGSSYCDHNGNLLFYSDGLTVWNRNHLVMANGSGLMGGQSSTTSALVVRHPANCHLYYLFTVQDHLSVSNSFRYSLIDMSLNGGLGGVVVGMKNILISNSCAEKIVAIRHQNGVDSWIITHYLGNANFGAYLLSSSGLNPVPVISTTGATHPSNCMIGFLKSNHAGNLLVSAQMFCSSVQLFDFSRSTGMVSNPRILLNNLNGIYGAEFSPNDQILYLSKGFSGSALYQVDPSSVTNTFLVSSMAGDYNYGGLQMGPNGKIYMARNATASLGVVNSPNTWGPGCSFASNGFALAPGTASGFGIVSFATDQSGSFSPGGYQIASNDTCFASPSSFAGLGIVEYDSIVWNFGDPSSGTLNHATGLTSNHYYTSAGAFQVTMIVYGCEPDTLTVPVNVLPCVLPLDLEIDAIGIRDEIHLSWMVTDDGDYRLERSSDASYFVPVFDFQIGIAPMEGSFSDKNIEAGLTYYYRMRHRNSAGDVEVSQMVEAKVDAHTSSQCALFPTIYTKGVEMRLECATAQDPYQVDLINLDGRIVHAQIIEGGISQAIDLKNELNQGGMYFLRIQHGSDLEVHRFLVR